MIGTATSHSARARRRDLLTSPEGRRGHGAPSPATAREATARGSPPPTPGRAVSGAALAAVEDLVAEVLEPERRVVGAALGRLADAGAHHLADEHGVISLLDRLDEAALHVGRRAREDGRPRRA